MGIFALQSAAGGFLDEDLKRFNKEFDDWCAQFDSYEEANLARKNLPKNRVAEVVYARIPFGHPTH
ncbi:MAG: hypothetical protein RBR54_08230 [Sulfurimonas sp.]|jgi:hypothetical protein|nr:hypothetical protein [Sulfurimonas sp.]